MFDLKSQILLKKRMERMQILEAFEKASSFEKLDMFEKYIAYHENCMMWMVDQIAGGTKEPPQL